MGVFTGNQKNEPMHYGEVYKVWLYLGVTKGLLGVYEGLLNHTGDEDLRKFIEDAMQNVMKPEIKQFEELLTANGIETPPSSPERPKLDTKEIEDIPAGARFSDLEIVTSIGADIAAGLATCSAIMAQCIREDIAMMFVKCHATKVQYGERLLKMKKEKGWIIPPPLHPEK